MSTAPSAPSRDGFYSKLTEEEDNHWTDAGLSAHPVSSVRRMLRSSGPGPYRLVAICLATLCAVLLISLIAVSAHYKNRPQGGDGTTSGAQIQTQTQDGNVSALIATVNKLQQEGAGLQKEKAELQRERDELLAKLAVKLATKAPEVITKATPPPIVCPADWVLFNSSCYFISRNSRDWPESQSYCQSQGAHLAIIHTAEEQTFLWDLLPRGHWNAFWFGITDEHTEDQWKWVDGTPLVGGDFTLWGDIARAADRCEKAPGSYYRIEIHENMQRFQGQSFWEVGEPNNHIDEDCGYIVKTRVLERVAVRSWYDAPCSMYRRFICEKEMGPGVSTAVPH